MSDHDRYSFVDDYENRGSSVQEEEFVDDVVIPRPRGVPVVCIPTERFEALRTVEAELAQVTERADSAEDAYVRMQSDAWQFQAELAQAETLLRFAYIKSAGNIVDPPPELTKWRNDTRAFLVREDQK